jgi:hypothetical protein
MGATGLEPVTPSVSISPGATFLGIETSDKYGCYADRLASSMSVERHQSSAIIPRKKQGVPQSCGTKAERKNGINL